MDTIALPPLREDLDLLEGPVSRYGEPTWTIVDPVRNRYFRIKRAAFDLLSYWHIGDSKGVLETVYANTGSQLQMSDIEWLLHFLRSNFLVKRESEADIEQLTKVASAGRSSAPMWLLHRYLFFRIPLVHPQSFLQKTMPYVEVLYSANARWLILLCGVLGVYQVSRQWDSFLSTFLHFFSWDGVLWYALTLLFVKILHELGHAYTAVRAGCRVPSMGVAFLVMWPVLYTDTTEAWRLRNKKRKLAIGAAGITVELALALLATLLWSVLPDGAAKSAAFLVATITWVMSLLINLNPLMRFDGYYLLADWLEMDNLQDRSFALALWQLRESLFGLNEPAPEYFAPLMRNSLIMFGFATWVYRFFLFLGIAVLVYSFFFKALGILLFALEILWFIVLPVYRECKTWWAMRDKVQMNKHLARTLILVFTLVLLGSVPWQTTSKLPAVYSAQERVVIYAPRAARVDQIAIKQGDVVTQDQLLITLSDDLLRFHINNTNAQIQTYRTLLSRQGASQSDRQRARIIEQQLETELTRLNALQDQQSQLKIVSPIQGQASDINEHLREGVWVNEDFPLVSVTQPDKGKLVAYVSEQDIDGLVIGKAAHFYPDNLNIASFDAKVRAIAKSDTRQLEEKTLASVFGGEIAVEEDKNGHLVPLKGLYKVEFTIDRAAPALMQRGVVHVHAEQKSLFARWFDQISALFIQESGF